jgi:lipopolysaccharide cholinephosphotransferase
MKNIVLFGASQFGKIALENWKKQKDINVIAFCDNDKNKWGLSFQGIKVISPDDLTDLIYDEIIITSMYDVDILRQLVSMGINEDIIRISSVDTLATSFGIGDRLLMAQELMFYITDHFNKYKVDYYIDHGTLLGIIRDQSLLPWDKDIDFAVLEKQQNKVVEILDKHLTNYQSQYCSANNWFYHIRHDKHVKINSTFTLKPVVIKILNRADDINSNEFELDIKFKYEYDKNLYWTVGQRTLISNIDICFPTTLISYKDKKIRIPKDAPNYLKSLYGNWQETVKEWTYNQYTNIK